MPVTEIVHPDGSVVIRHWKAGTRPAYPWLQRAIAAPGHDTGYIELLQDESGVTAFGNEEDRLLELPANMMAMRRLHWPEPPEGWAAYDGNMGNHPGCLVFTSQEEYEAARGKYWSPVVGPVVFLYRFLPVDAQGEYQEREINPQGLGAVVNETQEATA